MILVYFKAERRGNLRYISRRRIEKLRRPYPQRWMFDLFHKNWRRFGPFAVTEEKNSRENVSLLLMLISIFTETLNV